MKTPTTPEGLRRYDHLTPEMAALRAWAEPGSDPEWHARAKEAVRNAMPLLAIALDRGVADLLARRARSAAALRREAHEVETRSHRDNVAVVEELRRRADQMDEAWP